MVPCVGSGVPVTVTQSGAMTIPWLSPADGGICRLGRATALSPMRRSGRRELGGKRRAIAPITNAVTVVGNGPNVSDNDDNYNSNHIEEVIHSNNEHPGFTVITGRLEQPANRR